MRTLIKFELAKLYKKKMNRIVFWGTCVVMAVLCFMNVQQSWIYDANGNALKGNDYVDYVKSNAEDLSGLLTGEKVRETIAEYHEIINNPENLTEDGEFTDEMFYQYYLPKSSYLVMIGHNYDEPWIQSYGSNLFEVKPQDGLQFYEQREKRLLQSLEIGTSDWKYTKAEKEYWIEANKRIETPFMYGYVGGWDEIIEMIGFLLIPILSVCIMTATVYAGEYEVNADHIILTTKYGKSKVIGAKSIAVYIYGLLFFTINVVLICVTFLGYYGTQGGNLPIQIMNAEIPYSYSFMQAVIIVIGIDYMILVAMMTITLFLSARMKGGLPVLAIMLIILLGALFLRVSEMNGIYNHIFYLLPYVALDAGMVDVLSYPFGSFVLNYVEMRYVLYLLLAVVLLPFAGRAFRRHQVQ